MAPAVVEAQYIVLYVMSFGNVDACCVAPGAIDKYGYMRQPHLTLSIFLWKIFETGAEDN